MPNDRSRTTGLRTVLAVLSALLLVAIAAVPVMAHVALASSGPADGETVQGTPTDVVVLFTEDLVPDRSFFNLKAPDGTTVGRGGPDPANPRALLLAPPELAPGAYRVEWQAIGTDGHIERGTFTFSVAPPAPTPTLTPTPTASPSRPTSEPSDVPSPSPSAPSTPATPAATPAPGAETPTSSDADVLIPILAALALIGGLGVFLVRRNRTR